MGYHDRIAPPIALGLNAKERKEYSILEGLRSMVLISEGKPVPPCMAFDIHKSLERLTGRSSPGLLIPVLDLHWKRSPMQVSSASLGGNAVGQVLSSDWIPALRSKLISARAGAKFLTDLSSNVDFPKQTGVSEIHWISEGQTIPESNLTLDLVSLKPSDVGAIVPLTRRLLMQSSLDIEGLIREDLLSCIAQAIDDVVFNGSGVNQPLGLLNHPEVSELAIGANGGALDWSHLVQMETEVAVGNVDTEQCCYVTNAAVVGKLKTTAKVVGQDSFLWQTQLNPLTNERLGVLNGYPGLLTNIIKNDRNKGSASGLSSIVFGDFSQLLIGEWGVLELLLNPYGAGYPGGVVQIRAMATIGCALRHPQAFCRITDVVTA